MSYIDPEGMFHGDRMALLSDDAKLRFPFFWCASNTVGRIELNYRKVINRAFHQFSTPPTEQQFWNWAREYRDAFLLFIYKFNGQVWGQWFVTERYLPKHKLAIDVKSPAPDGKAFDEWKDRYLADKLARQAGKLENGNPEAGEQKIHYFPNANTVNNSARLEKVATERRDVGSGSGSGEEVEKPDLLSSSNILLTPKKPENEKQDDDEKTNPQFETEADELVGLIHRATGQPPDRKLVEQISQFIETRGFTLRGFLDDIEPRLTRLKNKPTAGFFHDHASRFGGHSQEPIRAREIRAPCCRFGVLPDGTFCQECATGKDLRRATLALEREKSEKATEKQSCST